MLFVYDGHDCGILLAILLFVKTHSKTKGQAMIEYVVIATALVMSVFYFLKNDRFAKIVNRRTFLICDFLHKPIP